MNVDEAIEEINEEKIFNRELSAKDLDLDLDEEDEDSAWGVAGG
jgi:hypothetical protein